MIRDKADDSRGSKKYELTQSYKSYADYKLTQAYKSYADYAFRNNETRHPGCENSADSVVFTPTNVECQFSQLEICTAEVYCLYFY